LEESSLSSNTLGVWKNVRFLRKFWGIEEGTLSSEVLGNRRRYAFFGSFGEWKKVRFLRKFWGMEESTLSSKVLGYGRKYAFFESF
jgi:hypothetical protein